MPASLQGQVDELSALLKDAYGRNLSDHLDAALEVSSRLAAMGRHEQAGVPWHGGDERQRGCLLCYPPPPPPPTWRQRLRSWWSDWWYAHRPRWHIGPCDAFCSHDVEEW